MNFPVPHTTFVILRISQIIYLIVVAVFLAALLLLDFNELPKPDRFIVQGSTIATLVTAVFMSIFVEKVIRSLKTGQFWAWVAAIILCGLYIPSAFLPLGIIGLVGLLSKKTRKFFVHKS